MHTPAISIIIPVFNNWKLTANCLQSIARQRQEESVEIIVVDNASTDDTASQCPVLGNTLFPKRFHYLANEQNLNFAGACNRGAATAKAPLLFFLNNDTLWSENILPALVETLQTPGVGCCGPLLLNGDDSIQHLGVGFLHAGKLIHVFRNFPRDHRVTRNTIPLQAITAAALLISASLFQAIGGFHEGYRNGFEDLDLCYQLRQRRLRPAVTTQVSLYHLEGQTAGRLDNERANIQLYKQRTSPGFSPDIDLFAEVNAMELKLNQWFQPYFVSNRATHKRCLALIRQGASLHAVLQQEPCWEQGYHLLLQRCADKAAEALAAAQVLFRFCPNLEHVTLLLKLARSAARPDIESYYATLHDRFLGAMKAPELPVLAAAMRTTALEQGRRHFAEALEHWIETHAKGHTHAQRLARRSTNA